MMADNAEVREKLAALEREKQVKAAMAAAEQARLADKKAELERMMAEVNAAEDARKERAAQVAVELERETRQLQSQLPEPPPPAFLRELTAAEFDRFVNNCVKWLKDSHPQRYRKLEDVFGGEETAGGAGRRLVEDIMLALRNNTMSDGQLSTCFNLFVNGDPQRGKSNVEAIMVLVVHYINNSMLYQQLNIRDRCYSLLGSVMIGWAQSLFNNAQDLMKQFSSDVRSRGGDDSESEGLNEDDDDVSDDEESEEQAGDSVLHLIGAELVLSSSKGDLDRQCNVARKGGVLVFPRNNAAMENVVSVIKKVWHDAYRAGEVPPVHFVFLDEADQMRGSTAEHRREKAKGDMWKYELQLCRMFGVGSESKESRLPRPALVVDVSATNQLGFLAMLLRLHDKSRKLLDILSFVDDPSGYSGMDACVRFDDMVLEDKQLSCSNFFIDEDSKAWYRNVISEPNACGLVVTTNRVTAKPCNMDEHFKAASDDAVAQLEAADKRTAHVGVIVHGGQSRYRGCMGIYLCGGGRDGMLMRVNRELRRLKKEPIELDLSVTGKKSAHLHAEDLRPLLEDLDNDNAKHSAEGVQKYRDTKAEAKKAGTEFNKPEPKAYCSCMPPAGKKLTYVQLPLLLALLRKLFGTTPVFVVGHGMVRRCLSLVGCIHLPGGERKTTLVVTHMLLWAAGAANGAGVVQQAGRCCHTLMEFYDDPSNALFIKNRARKAGSDEEQPEPKVPLLAPQLVWDYIDGGRDFNRWFSCAEEGKSAAEARDKIVADITNVARCWDANGGDSAAFAIAVVECLHMPEKTLRYLSSRGAVPPNAAERVKQLRDALRTLKEQADNSDFGVIVVRPDLDPMAPQPLLHRFVFRTVGCVGATPQPALWSLGEVQFASKAERDGAKEPAQAVADAVNKHLAEASVAGDVAWRGVQERCIEAFKRAKERAEQEGGNAAAQMHSLADKLNAELNPTAPPDGDAMDDSA